MIFNCVTFLIKIITFSKNKVKSTDFTDRTVLTARAIKRKLYGSKYIQLQIQSFSYPVMFVRPKLLLLWLATVNPWKMSMPRGCSFRHLRLSPAINLRELLCVILQPCSCCWPWTSGCDIEWRTQHRVTMPNLLSIEWMKALEMNVANMLLVCFVLLSCP